MSGKTKNILIISIVIVSVAVFFASLRADTVSNHRFFVMTSDRLDALSRARREKDLEGQSKWKVSGYDRFRVIMMELINITFDGVEPGGIGTYHREALVRLGHLSREEFSLTNWTEADLRDFKTPARRELYTAMSDLVRSGKSGCGSVSFSFSPPGIVVFDMPSRMSEWKSVLGELDAKHVK